MAKPVGMTKFGQTIYKPTRYIENKMANTAYAGSDSKDNSNIIDLFLKIKNSNKAHNQEVAAVCAGIGGGFEKTTKHRVMKYNKAVNGKDKEKWEKAVNEEHKE